MSTVRDLRAALLFTLAALLVACVPTDDGGPDSSADAGVDLNVEDGADFCGASSCGQGAQPVLWVGTADDLGAGVLAYKAIADGDEVPIVTGVQGGQHIWVLLRAQDVASCFVRPHYQLIDPDGAVVFDGYFGGEFYEVPAAPGTFEFLAYAALIPNPEALHRTPVTLRAEVSDGCGHWLEDEVDIVPVDPRLDEVEQVTDF